MSSTTNLFAPMSQELAEGSHFTTKVLYHLCSLYSPSFPRVLPGNSFNCYIKSQLSCTCIGKIYLVLTNKFSLQNSMTFKVVKMLQTKCYLFVVNCHSSEPNTVHPLLTLLIAQKMLFAQLARINDSLVFNFRLHLILTKPYTSILIPLVLSYPLNHLQRNSRTHLPSKYFSSSTSVKTP